MHLVGLYVPVSNIGLGLSVFPGFQQILAARILVLVLVVRVRRIIIILRRPLSVSASEATMEIEMPLDPVRHEFMRYNNYGVMEY